MGFFDQSNPLHQQMAQAYNSGTYHQLPANDVMSSYQSFVQSGPPEEVNQIHQDYFNQMPQVERTGLFSSLLGAMGGQQGFNPNQAGLSTTDPNRASGLDLGNLFNAARGSGLLGGLMGGNQQQQQPGYYNQGSSNAGGIQGLQGLMSNPLAQAAISGLVGYAANRMINGAMNRGSSQQPSYNQPSQQPSQNYGQGGGNFGGTNTQTMGLGGGGSALPGFENNNQGN